MRLRALASAFALGATALLGISCSIDAPTAPQATVVRASAASHALPAIRIAEFHYDNVSTDAGEAIEISGPVGASLDGWQIVLYNGANGQAYNTRTLTGSIPAVCGADATRGVVVASYPVNGIQNGNPDGIALLDNTGAVVELLSYGGSFVAVNGPAVGQTLPDIGVAESGTTPVGFSLQRNAEGVWQAPAANTFGSCNDGTTGGEEPAEIAAVSVSPEAATISVGASVELVASATDAEGAAVAASFTWTSRDEGIATVVNGSVTGVDEGSTYVVASTGAFADSALITVEAGGEVELPAVRFSELHYDNFGTDIGEAIEIEGPAGTDVTGWSIVLYNGNGGAAYDTKVLSGVIPDQCEGRGTLFVEYPSNGIQNGAPDGFALVNAAGTLVEFLSYEGTFTGAGGAADGVLSTDIIAFQNSAQVGKSLHRTPANVWEERDRNFGYCLGQVPPPPPNGITFSGRDASDPALPVGFEDQLFATLRDGSTGATIVTTFTWLSETPALASVDARGVVRALGVGAAIVRATAEDGTTATYTVQTREAAASTSASYANHLEFGTPVDGNAADDILVVRSEFVSSWNPARGIPNWVAYNLEATHFGAEDRCDCFTFDPELSAYTPYTTADYTGAGAVAGYGIDRGHLARSFDRTAGSLDNARSFYFSNIIPQASDNNQGPWAAMENYLGDLARFSDRELFIIAGASGSKGTVKNEGRITIPATVWKVAVILPRNAGLADVTSLDDVEIIAAILPNDAGIRNVDWNTYRTTVDAVEALSGYDLLALLRDDLEIALESNTVFPTAAVDGPYAAYAGDAIDMSALASTDADGDALSFAWAFGDGATATGATVSHSYAAPGDYTVRVIVTDIRGLADTVETTASITALPPAVALARAIALVDALVADGTLSRGAGTALRATLNAATQSVERGNAEAARGQIGATLNQVEALVRSGRLSPADAAALQGILERGLNSL